MVLEKSPSSAGPRSYHLDLIVNLPPRNASTLSPYSAIFCRQSAQPPERNHNKVNAFRKTARKNGSRPAVNPLLFNILRVSPSGSIFCPESHRSTDRNIKKTRILQNQQKKLCGMTAYGFSPASVSSRSLNFCTSSAITYFNASIPLPVTAEISYRLSLCFLQ
jgi:hypothetical protein